MIILRPTKKPSALRFLSVDEPLPRIEPEYLSQTIKQVKCKRYCNWSFIVWIAHFFNWRVILICIYHSHGRLPLPPSFIHIQLIISCTISPANRFANSFWVHTYRALSSRSLFFLSYLHQNDVWQKHFRPTFHIFFRFRLADKMKFTMTHPIVFQVRVWPMRSAHAQSLAHTNNTHCKNVPLRSWSNGLMIQLKIIQVIRVSLDGCSTSNILKEFGSLKPFDTIFIDFYRKQ